MWREFSRETPARPGLAWIAGLIGLVGTSALAWALVSRTSDTAPLGPPQSPPYWPIRFALPQGAQRFYRGLDELGEASATLGGDSGVEEYLLGPSERPTAVVLAHYRLLPEALAPREAWQALVEEAGDGPAVGEGESLTMGPLEGRFWALEQSSGARRLVAVGCLPSGLAIVFDYLSFRPERRDERVFRDICGSIRLTAWRTPRR